MIFILQLAIVISSVLSQCKEGCLRCDTEKDFCLFCDTKAGFQTVRGRCIFAQQQNCAIQNTKGNCIKCNKGYYVDSLTYTCVESSKAGTVENCAEYIVDNQCTTCLANFYLTTKNKCIVNPTPIDNCRLYTSPTICNECTPGFMLAVNMKKCITPPALNNCASYTPLKCIQCKEGYKENKNNYLYELLSFKQRLNINNIEKRLLYDQEVYYNQQFNVCQYLQVPNCQIHNQFNQCSRCQDGFYLQVGSCIPYPQEKIDNCVRYSSLSVCLQCIQGMFLKSPSECAKIVSVSDCVTYDPSSDQTVCTECQKDFFLSEPNICSRRTKDSTIANCLTLNLKAEKCRVCLPTFTLTSDEQKCLPSIANCQTYTLSDINFDALICDTCNPGYFYSLISKTCEEGSVEKCKIYYKNTNTCDVCQNRYYLSGAVCKTHEDLVYCSQYQNLQKNSCQVCNDRTVLFNRINTCLPVEPIQFCDIYLTQTQCQLCLDGYELTPTRKCQMIPQTEFCLQKTAGKCTLCISNYVLENGFCQLPLHHLIRNCEQHNVNGLNKYSQITCSYCKENFIPLNYKDSYVCHENQYVQSQLSVVLISNCNQYKKINGVYACQNCDATYLLTDGLCVKAETCDSTKTLRFQVIQQVDSNGDGAFDSFYIDRINECGDPVKNCEIAAPELNQDLTTISYSCTRCRTSAISVVSFDQRAILSKPPRHSSLPPMISPLSNTPSRECESKLTSQILGEVKDGQIENCDLYQALTDFGYGCLKCQQNYSGLIVDLVYNCKIFGSLNTCIECQENYYPKTPYRCERYVNTQFCVKYNTKSVTGECILCQEKFFLDNNICVSRNNFLPNCLIYQPNSQICTECQPDFTLLTLNADKKCAKKQLGCAIYNFNTTVCTTCLKTWYIINSICYLGQVANCAEYAYVENQNLVNRCTFCQNGFYLTKNNTCLAQPTVPRCETYFQEKGYCKKCMANNILFTTPKKCVKTVIIKQCIQFKSQESCVLCNPGYYPVNYGQRCLAIPVAKKCKSWGKLSPGVSQDENNCLQCELGYLLINGACKAWFDSLTKYCVQANPKQDGFRSFASCKYCNIVDFKALNKDVSLTHGVCVENDLLKTYSASKLIDNCINYTYDVVTDVFTCTRCASTFYLMIGTHPDANKKCLSLDKCLDKHDGTTYFVAPIYKYKGLPGADNVKNIDFTQPFIDVCFSAAAQPTDFAVFSNKCLQASTLKATPYLKNFSYECMKCSSSKPIQIVTQAVFPQFMHSPNPQFITQVEIPISSCKSLNDIITATKKILGSVNGNGLISNCEFYSLLNTDYGCVSCKKGFRGLVYTESTTFGYIKECEAFTDCTVFTDDNQLHSNINITTAFTPIHDMNVLFKGCQRCANVVVVFVDKTAFTLSSYSATAVGTIGTAVSSDWGYNLQCLTYNFTGNGITLALPQYCAKAVFQLHATAVSSCVSCKPGYYPTRDGTNNQIITACTAFDAAKCETSTLFENICSKCKPNYYFEYDSTKKSVSYETNCITPTAQTPNCHAVNANGACGICNKGYFLKTINSVQKCVLIQIANCDAIHENATVQNSMMPFINTYLNQKKDECNFCSNNFTNVLKFNDYVQKLADTNVAPDFVQHKNICYNTDDVDFFNSLAPASPNYAMCVATKYSYYLLSTDQGSLDIHCRECDGTGVITLDGKCVLKTNNQNCLVAQSVNSNFCSECEKSPKYISVAGVCIKETDLDQQCEIFADSSFTTGSICVKCKNFHYLERKIQDGKYVTKCIQYYATAIAPSDDKPIKNCAQFNSENLDRLYCIECISTFALLILEADEVQGNAGYKRQCIDVKAQMDGMFCQTLDLEAQQQGQLVCKTCSNFIGANGNYTEQYFLIDRDQKDQDQLNTCVQWAKDANCETYSVDSVLERVFKSVTYKYNYLPKFSTLACQKCLPTHFLKQDTDTCTLRVNTYSTNCDKFEIFQDFCQVCKQNFFLSSDKLSCLPAPIVRKAQGHLLSCKIMKECNPDVNFDGLHPHLEQLVSCHSCRKPTNIPFVAVSGNASFTAITQINEYGVTGNFTGKTYVDFAGGKSVFCSAALKESFNITDPLKWNFPTNCAIGVLNVDSLPDSSDSNKTTGIDRTKIGIFCGACKPGFKPTYGIDSLNVPIQFMIGSCTAINNCEESHAFNHCTKCKMGFSFEFVNGKVNYQNCVALPTIAPVNNDCYSYNPLATVCVYCCKGFYLNKDNFCERIQPAKCEYQNFNYRNIYNKLNLHTGLYLDSEGTGCRKCEAGFSGIFIDKNQWICTESLIHKNKALADTTLYLKNCKNYYVDNNLLKCIKCYNEYIPIQSTGVCTKVTSDLNQCVIAQDATFCRVCSDEYVLVNRKCEKKAIDKCEIYFYNDESQYQVCKDCQEGYYLDANKCYPGDVQNCLRFETKIVCNLCQQGFHLVKRNDGVSYCYPIDKSLSCAAFNSNDFQTAKLTCTKCITNQFVINTDSSNFYRTHCLKFFEIINCVRYDIKPAIADSSFKCLECTPQFFISDRVCVIRTVMLDNCAKYQIDADKCLECKLGFYANVEGNNCLEYPTGTKGCRIYSNKFTCNSCIQNMQLQGDLCLPISDDSKIENCLYYVDRFNCDKCAEGYQLKDKKCNKIQALNCLTLESITSCASCNLLSGFVETNGIKSCVVQTVPNCLEINPVSVPGLTQIYKCIRCVNNFYADKDGVCQAIVVLITNCISYSALDTCQKCNSTSALSVDKKSCTINRIVMENYDINCQESQILGDYLCNSCKPGFIFLEGVCVACETDSSVCYNCDPQDKKKCLMCNSGYRMTTQGLCEAYASPNGVPMIGSTPVSVPQTTASTTTAKSGVKIRLVILSIFAWILI